MKQQRNKKLTRIQRCLSGSRGSHGGKYRKGGTLRRDPQERGGDGLKPNVRLEKNSKKWPEQRDLQAGGETPPRKEKRE